MTGSIRLRDYPGDIVRLGCDRCGRSGQYRKQTLIAQYGPDIVLPDLRHEIAQCERRGLLRHGGHRNDRTVTTVKLSTGGFGGLRVNGSPQWHGLIGR
jgi:hypothetical protein